METQHKQLDVAVFSYKPDFSDKSKIMYNISITFENQSWIITKRYSEFDDLYKQLKVCFRNQLPELPKKTYTSFLFSKTHDDIEQRRIGLDKFLKLLTSKQEILSSNQMKEFLKLEEHAKTLVVNQPQIIHEFSGFLHGVRDFNLCIGQGILFVVNSDYSIFNRLDAYLTNMKGPWEKEDGQQAVMPVGCIECWIQQQDGLYTRQWAKMYNSQAICCFWDPSSFVLLVGLDSGSINYLEVPYSQGFKKCETDAEIQQHQSKVTGLYYDNERSLIHSVSKDKRYKIRNAVKSIYIYDNEISPYELTDLVVSKSRRKSFVSDKNGFIYMFDINEDKVIQLNFINTNIRLLKCLKLDSNQNLLMAIGQETGEIIMIDIGSIKCEKQLRWIGQINTKTKGYKFCWSQKRKELFVGTSDGTVQFWDYDTKQLIFVLKAHDSEITQMQWIEEDQHLLTSSRDKEIKTWLLPLQWKNQQVK
ncbi:unnamed protein product [Paramecium primaurelia]|uniref:PX domain-containing protein n=1 Tax=Paramecium primaurelia TaxID=5886 RepID=A0A8S1MPF0_PARPR|nr:unnamed protein product [Paramecium primaurelia]